MPIYRYYCDQCGHYNKKTSTVAERHEQRCDECGCELDLAPTFACQTMPDIEPYFDEGLGCYIDSRQQKKQILDDKGLTHVSDFASEHPDEWVAEKQEEARKMIKEQKEISRAEANR